MTKEKCLKVISFYRQYFEKENIPKGEVPHGVNLVYAYRLQLHGKATMHAHGMLDQMEVFITEGRMDKFFRWLGFVQGVLWTSGHFSLEELKNHNRSSEE